ncbi:DUF3110 domain-containing protein [Cylindrospermum sp. FACHB-282]|uniref:DUF3110 domain-containing protein n=1 Tax=Cylindrospermum sp. FACHB-282 TaxID=2692794 RepID=UPI001686BCE1|nr:DUF3110 domain-containing protein [Cylindrospermum sp. FACHB-282]MBD2387163.1 DUF3110 domain-containing protein [Cylindrospermum sp. FACHB-282]
MITPMRVFVLIFNAGTDNEGIHSIQVGERNKILMFESEDDATRFSLMLEAQDFAAPTVEAMDAEDIKEFCEGAGYNWEIVPAGGDLVVPPEINVEETDWQAGDEKGDTGKATGRPNPVAPDEPELSNSELDNIRRQLEGLL